MRIRIIKPTAKYKVGQVVDISPKKAYKLISSGIAIVSKDITQEDTRTN